MFNQLNIFANKVNVTIKHVYNLPSGTVASSLGTLEVYWGLFEVGAEERRKLCEKYMHVTNINDIHMYIYVFVYASPIYVDIS